MICIDDVPLKKEEKAVFLLNKPKNVISSAADEKGRRTVVDLIDTPLRIYPLGRLDYDSSGLILLSNDGELMQKLIHPRFEVEKEYEVTCNGLVDDETINHLSSGVKVDDYISAPAKIILLKSDEIKNRSYLKVIIHEGKNRQIRKMFAAAGHEVIRLHRTKEACIELGELKSGEYRRLKPYEIKKLKAYLDRNDL